MPLLVVSMGNKILFKLSNSSDKLTIDMVVDTVKDDVEKCVKFGLDEWIYEGGDKTKPIPRHTDPNDPLFLERLGEDLKRQFNFTFELITGSKND